MSHNRTALNKASRPILSFFPKRRWHLREILRTCCPPKPPKPRRIRSNSKVTKKLLSGLLLGYFGGDPESHFLVAILLILRGFRGFSGVAGSQGKSPSRPWNTGCLAGKGTLKVWTGKMTNRPHFAHIPGANMSKDLVLEGTGAERVWVFCFQWLYKHKLNIIQKCLQWGRSNLVDPAEWPKIGLLNRSVGSILLLFPSKARKTQSSLHFLQSGPRKFTKSDFSGLAPIP